VPASSEPAAELLRLERVQVGYGGRPILPPVDLRLHQGSFLGIVGHSGSGKSTLVRTLLGLLPPISGKVIHPLGRRPRFGYLPQRAAFEPSFPMTTLDMVVMGRYPLMGLGRRPSQGDRAMAASLLGEMGLAGFEQAQVMSLSGGQRQRALVARALIGDPEILVLDEPTNGLDILTERAFLDQVDRERHAVEQGKVDEVINADRLSRLYGRRVVVEDVHGHRAVFLDCEHEAPHPKRSEGA
jgi:ABC-type Mn2+/Zn2+ transport system ATPase subunit